MRTVTAADSGTDVSRLTEIEVRVDQFVSDHPRRDYPDLPEDLGYGYGSWSADFLRSLGQAGLIGLLWPSAVGGAAATPAQMYYLMRVLADSRSPAEALIYSEAVGSCILAHGSPALARRILPSIIDGSATCCEALSEPDAGSDLFALRTSAVRDGNDFVINGQKIWTSNGWCARYALVAVRTDKDKPRHRGISVLLVDLQSAGVTRRPIRDLLQQPSYSEIYFDDVRVPADCLVGELNAGLPVVLELLHWDRLWARCVKAPYLRRELADLVALTKTRRSGRSLLWDDPLVRSALAQLAIEIDVCESMFDRAIELEEIDRRDGELIAMAKLFADRLGHEFYRQALSILGIDAVLDDAPDLVMAHWARAYLNSHGLLVAGGTAEMQKIAIARRRLGFGVRQA